jgi:hypothetical protein
MTKQSNKQDEINISWSISDIKDIDDKLTDSQARKVLSFLLENHNAEIGINWEVIKEALNYLKQEGGL